MLKKLFAITAVFLVAGSIIAGADASQEPGWYPPPYAAGKRGETVLETPKNIGSGFKNSEKVVTIEKNGRMRLALSSSMAVADLYFFWYREPVWMDTSGLKDPQFGSNDNSYAVSGSMPMKIFVEDDKSSFPFEQKTTLTEDGRLRVDINCATPKMTSGKGLLGRFEISIPFSLCAGRKLIADGKEYAFPQKENTPIFGFPDKAAHITFFPDSPEEFSIETASAQIGHGPTGICYTFQPPDNAPHISFLLDIRKVAKAESGAHQSSGPVDFWGGDRLVVPRDPACRNLLFNPSFEGGLRYYTLCGTWVPGINDKKNEFASDGNVSKFGRHSLRMTGSKGSSGFIQSFAVPAFKGKNYTVSFYAKADVKGMEVKSFFITGEWGNFPADSSMPISGEWSRHSTTFTAPNQTLSFVMGPLVSAKNSSGSGTVWIDGLQLEEGDAATDFTCAPISASLVSSSPDNFFHPGEAINAKIILNAEEPGRKGKIAVALQDIFYDSHDIGVFDFDCGDKCSAEIPLALDSLVQNGVYVLKTVVSLEGCADITDYMRVSRINKLAGTRMNKDLINYQAPRVNPEKMLARFQEIGIGSVVYPGYPNKEKEAIELYNKHQLAQYCEIVSWDLGDDMGSVCVPDSNGKKQILFQGIRLLDKMTPWREKAIEDACFEHAKYYDYFKSWALGGEWELWHPMVKSKNYKDCARMMVAAAKGFKRANPKNQVYPECGGASFGSATYLYEYLKAANALYPDFKFDRLAIHPYRNAPEYPPDLDSQTQSFIDNLAKLGYTNEPIDYLEAIYYAPYNVPEWGLTPYRGCTMDHYRCENISYHMGWGERISAAFAIRSWLVGLKYQDRIKVFNNWGGWIGMDTQLAPMVIQPAINTLVNLLGNAYFKKDIRFAANSRAYVFEDENKRPVAALWACAPAIDTGGEAPQIAELPICGDTELIDFTGRTRKFSKAQGKIKFALSPFPVYFRGESGTLNALVAAVEAVTLAGAKTECPVTLFLDIDTRGYFVTAVNLLTVPFEGKLVLNMNGVDKEVSLHLGAKAKVENKIGELAENSALAEQKIKYQLFDARDNSKYSGELAQSGFLVNHAAGGTAGVNGAFGGWDKIPWRPIKNRWVNKGQEVGYPGDFDAKFKTVWDNDNLYLLVEVTDDKFVHEKYGDDKGGVGRRGYDNDSLQVYFDTGCDNRLSASATFDSNDYEYDFCPEVEKGNAIVYRRIVPDQQVGGGLMAAKPDMVDDRVKANFKLTKEGYSYDITFPRVSLFPVNFEAGTKFGFALFLNDKDEAGKPVKSGLTLTPEGTSPYQNHNLWPVAVLD